MQTSAHHPLLLIVGTCMHISLLSLRGSERPFKHFMFESAVLFVLLIQEAQVVVVSRRSSRIDHTNIHTHFCEAAD